MNDSGPFVHAIEICGIRTVYYERGSGPPLVLVHGMFGDFADWETVLEPLAGGFRVVAPDLPGFGASAKPDAAYDTEFFLNWLRGFLDALNIERTVLVGNSFGGEIAVLFALAHPERVQRLVLASSGGLRFYSEAERSEIQSKFSVENFKALTPAIHAWMFGAIFAEKGAAWKRYLEKQNRKLLRDDFGDYAVALYRSITTAFSLYFEEELTRLRIPVLLVWGDRDVVFPMPLAERALGLLPNGELVILEGAGHAPQLENPEEFVAALQRFVTTLDQQVSAARP
jgi:2-hydroxy-6-oxonona-2,4-dienedioate hydrolase